MSDLEKRVLQLEEDDLKKREVFTSYEATFDLIVKWLEKLEAQIKVLREPIK